jgi:Methyltransferase domain
MKTDWDRYYRKPFPAAALSRQVTAYYLKRMIRKYAPRPHPTIIELGGGNSCFRDGLYRAFGPSTYTMVDIHKGSLLKVRERAANTTGVRLIHDDVLNPSWKGLGDVVFSVGLIEHFSEAQTRRAVRNHFSYAREDSMVLISFPTPTFLYRATRKISESLGLWIFHDEHPLPVAWVLDAAKSYGRLLEKRIIWPILFTQAMVVLRPETPKLVKSHA